LAYSRNLSFSRVVSKSSGRVSRVAVQSQCHACHGLRPRGSCHNLAITGCASVDFRLFDGVVLPVALITGLNPFNLSAYGLRACWPTLSSEHYCSPPKVSLLGGWLSLPRWASLPLDFTVLPGRSNSRSDPRSSPDSSFSQNPRIAALTPSYLSPLQASMVNTRPCQSVSDTIRTPNRLLPERQDR